MTALADRIIVLRGGGDLATGVAWRLHNAGFHRIVILERDRPLAVRRQVALSEAVYEGQHTVEGVTAKRVATPDACPALWAAGYIPLIVDPAATCVASLRPDVLIEATVSKRNIGVTRADAPLVIGLGPGFTAGHDVHCVIETQRGDYLGRALWHGSAEPNTGIPAPKKGYGLERVLRAPVDGTFVTEYTIGRLVEAGETVTHVLANDGSMHPVKASISGVIRGLLRTGIAVAAGVKIGDIDPDPHAQCDSITEKALSIGGGVLEAVLHTYLRQTA